MRWGGGWLVWCVYTDRVLLCYWAWILPFVSRFEEGADAGACFIGEKRPRTVMTNLAVSLRRCSVRYASAWIGEMEMSEARDGSRYPAGIICCEGVCRQLRRAHLTISCLS
ncbi:hypothetical protein OE88DRAFT_454368 [Heliocybe sulcata]|uniref:Uncharacterized protein n=1 Tax=Heliocybe sulcata TaxID=5364 RepID=A0A5C3MVX4_9AGAM|nr:hypothetical protein OE88DRAFT_454368 [Heliocybe sulcata]